MYDKLSWLKKIVNNSGVFVNYSNSENFALMTEKQVTSPIFYLVRVFIQAITNSLSKLELPQIILQSG